MNIQDFFTKWNNKFVDFDKAYGNTCVDLYRQYCKEVLQIPQSPSMNGAAELWIKYGVDFFDKIWNTPLGVPQSGDLVVWSDKLNGLGHVAIFQSGNIWSFTSFDQNWPIGSPCHFQKHNYKHILGWLRPKIVVSTPNLPKVPLKIARIGLNLADLGAFQAQVTSYSQNKISFTTNDILTEVKKDVGMFTQEDTYALVDKLNPAEKFIFIFYPPNSTSAFAATYWYPKRKSCITTSPSSDPKVLAFEFAHQLGIMVNATLGYKFPIEDSMYPNDDFIKKKYDLASPYYQNA